MGTYTRRLWCVMELYVYKCMSESHNITVVPLLEEHENEGGLNKKWNAFDAADCDCFDPNDKAKMMAIFENGHGGVEGFNREVRKLMSKRIKRSSTTRSSS